MSSGEFEPVPNPIEGRSFRNRMLALVGGGALMVGGIGLASRADGRESLAVGDGNGSPAECLHNDDPLVIGSITGSSDLVAFSAPDGYTIEGVCIKSGNNMFDGTSHSGLLGNGVYEDDCYEVSGVGTGSVSVERLREGPDCQGISHVDALKEKKDTSTTSTTTTTTTPTTSTTTSTTLPSSSTTTSTTLPSTSTTEGSTTTSTTTIVEGGSTTSTTETPTTTLAPETTTTSPTAETTTTAPATTTAAPTTSTTAPPEQTTTTTSAPRFTLPESL